MRWRDLRVVAFDTETTGLNPFEDDRIIEFAAVVFRVDAQGRVVSRDDHSWLVNPGIPIPRKVTEITGISDADVARASRFAEKATEVFDLLAGSVAVAHNFPFDLAFVTRELRSAGLDWPEPTAEVDTVDLSIKHFPDARGHKLEDLCRRLEVPLDGAHRAVNDAAATGLCFLELARRHQVQDDLHAMLDWAMAIGRPPEEGPLATDDSGRVVFSSGPHQGEPAAEHPVHLAWMEKARVKGPEGWRWRYSESVRAWIRRWLVVRGAGRARQNPKSFHRDDWVLHSCIAAERRRSP